jgi:hypothetical protein
MHQELTYMGMVIFAFGMFFSCGTYVGAYVGGFNGAAVDSTLGSQHLRYWLWFAGAL